ncbi:MAG: histidine phosphatase family protein [Anaerovoracaceae bacterium]
MGNKNVGVCILAGGYSSRMGAFKPLLPLGDETVIERLIHVAKGAEIGHIVVVTGHERELIQPIIFKENVLEAYNPRFSKGMFTSIQKGIEKSLNSLDGVFIIPVDCPLVTSDILRQMMEHFKPGEEDFRVPCYRGKKGHPLLVPSRYLKDILSYDGNQGLKGITDKYFSKMMRIETGDERVLLDMDTPKEYEEIKAFYEGGCKPDSLEDLTLGRRFFLIRHGQICQHKEKIFLGQTDVPLSDLGKEQGAKAREILQSYDVSIDKIYSSDLKRAKETAQVICDNVILKDSLREMNLGIWDGKYINEIKEAYPKEYEIRGKNLMTYKLGHGSENFYDLQYRVVKGLIDILKNDSSRDVIILSHSGVLRVILNNIKGKDVSDPWDKMANGEVRVVEMKEGKTS